MPKEIRGDKLICVATLYKGVVYVIPTPAEHQDVIDYIEYTLNEKVDDSCVHGFLTNKDEFVTLQEIELINPEYENAI
jgi:hypothetical protein